MHFVQFTDGIIIDLSFCMFPSIHLVAIIDISTMFVKTLKFYPTVGIKQSAFSVHESSKQGKVNDYWVFQNARVMRFDIAN